MKKLDFTYIAAKNFLPFGPDGIEINLKNYGNIVHVQGLNFDDVNENGRPGNNGVGKSSLMDIIAYTLYGRTVKKPKKLSHTNVINNRTKKGLRTEVIVGKYRIVRQREPNSLELWISEEHDWSEKNRWAMGLPETQKKIDAEIGISYETFVNVVVFDDSKSFSFLEADAITKREIVENLLSLEKYRSYHEHAKDKLKELVNKKKIATVEYETELNEVELVKNRIVQIENQEKTWKTKLESDIKTLIIDFKQKQTLLGKLDGGEEVVRYNEAQSDIKQFSEELVTISEQKQNVREEIKELENELYKQRREIEQFVNECGTILKEIDYYRDQQEKEIVKKKRIKSLEPGVVCSVCYGVIDPENSENALKTCDDIISSHEKVLGKLHLDHTQKGNERDEVVKKIDQETYPALNSRRDMLHSYDTQERTLQSKISELSRIKEPKMGLQQAILEEQLSSLKTQITKHKKEMDSPSPYSEILELAKKELFDKIEMSEKRKQEIDDIIKLEPYYDFWVEAFGDKGIRKFVIDGIIPALNNKIQYWLAFLIDNKITLSFNNKLEADIKLAAYNDKPFVYYSMSGGERQRLNLAVPHAFAHIMMLNAGIYPSLVFLDEVTSNIDPNGVEGIYSMIHELAKDRQVFITTHDKYLHEMLAGCDALRLEKRDGFTNLVN